MFVKRWLSVRLLRNFIPFLLYTILIDGVKSDLESPPHGYYPQNSQIYYLPNNINYNQSEVGGTNLYSPPNNNYHYPSSTIPTYLNASSVQQQQNLNTSTAISINNANYNQSVIGGTNLYSPPNNNYHYPPSTIPSHVNGSSVQQQNLNTSITVSTNNTNYNQSVIGGTSLHSTTNYHLLITTPAPLNRTSVPKQNLNKTVSTTENNGWCFANNTRKCCQGYHQYKHNKSLCIPNCNNCKNGYCRKPYKCECFQGFVKSLTGECVHSCPVGCLNGKCHSNGTCVCETGYKYSNYSNQICVPICINPCRSDMNCTAPNRCDCNKGYSFENGICVPVCGDSGCNRGICIAPDKCKCDKGYNLIKKVCQANCTKGCENGICAENEFCKCRSGYKLESGKINKCVPVCKSCHNGDCIAPDVCKCHKGYEKENMDCVPKCATSCKLHGRCIGPNHCKCLHPYKTNFLGDGCRYDSSSSTKPINIHIQPSYSRHPTTKPSYSRHPTTKPSYSKHPTTKPSNPIYRTTKPPNPIYRTTKPPNPIYRTTKPPNPTYRTTKPPSPIYRTTKSPNNKSHGHKK